MDRDTDRVIFIKIKEEGEGKKFPCLECKEPCRGYWCVNKYSNTRRPYPFCPMCLEGFLDKCNKLKETQGI